ncbi:hypothetical protein PSYMO_33635, partial [Pseudomonas amygdali pv. mori str. 301020]
NTNRIPARATAASGKLLVRKDQIPENRRFTCVGIYASIAHMIHPAYHVSTTLIQPAGTQVIVLGFQNDAGQIALAAPELSDIEQ